MWLNLLLWRVSIKLRLVFLFFNRIIKSFDNSSWRSLLLGKFFIIVSLILFLKKAGLIGLNCSFRRWTILIRVNTHSIRSISMSIRLFLKLSNLILVQWRRVIVASLLLSLHHLRIVWSLNKLFLRGSYWYLVAAMLILSWTLHMVMSGRSKSAGYLVLILRG